jgi:hypothetical protein
MPKSYQLSLPLRARPLRVRDSHHQTIKIYLLTSYTDYHSLFYRLLSVSRSLNGKEKNVVLLIS